MRKAIIDDGTGAVLDVVSLPDNWTGYAGEGEPGEKNYRKPEWQPPGGTILVEADGAEPGDTWDGEKFTKPSEPPDVSADEQAVALLDTPVGQGFIDTANALEKRIALLEGAPEPKRGDTEAAITAAVAANLK